MRKALLIICTVLYSLTLAAQAGGKYTYEFLGLPSSARLTALGGALIAVEDDDVNLAADNPALLNSKMHNYASFSYNYHFDDIHNGSIAYGRSFDSLGITAHAAVEYVSYGDFVLADLYGNKEGTFSGSETAIIVGASKNFQDKINLGVNLKMITGSFESYSSVGMAADIGMLYRLPDKNMNLAVAIKNIGTAFTAYGTEKGYAPLDVQIGIAKRLKYIPFRFSVTAHQLQQWNIRQDDEQSEGTDIFGNPIQTTSNFEQQVDNLFRHLIFSGEFLIGKGESFRLRVAYNHLRRKELSVDSYRSLAGFSGGFGLSIRGFRLDYGVGYHHVAGATNHLSIATDLDRFFKNKHR